MGEESVEDRATRIRIQEVRAIPLGEKAYVQVRTNYGVHGWGGDQQSGLAGDHATCRVAGGAADR
ncbi:MAG: hypothetical protein KatS3mg115_2255 [Candidatus Poribacteria bacterium]|nr:MAG: hypothetical protein KatS3mg115_2255 [Candidatus Poribacteria bacterium]